MIRIVFFAGLREALGKSQIEISIDTSMSLAELRSAIIKQYPEWEKELIQKNILMSVNQQFASLESVVKTGDEVAFFPPVTGG
jgi:molybdopterin synthase sulfur carrier subunit